MLLLIPATALADLTPDPVDVDFGAVDRYNTAGFQHSVVFTNVSGVPRTITNVSITGSPDFSMPSGDCSGGLVLADNASCHVDVKFQPSTLGVQNATLTIVDDQPGVTAVPLTGDGISGNITANPDPIQFSPQPYFYGSQFAGGGINFAPNAGAHINSLQITGPDADLFSMSSDGCSGGDYPTNHTCNFAVTFNPTGPKTSTDAELVIDSNAPNSPISVPLLATALVGPEVTATPDIYDFGPVAVGTSSLKRLITVTNTGDFELQTQQLIVVSGSARFFVISDDACPLGTVIQPGQACSFNVQFAPGTAGLKEASVLIVSNAGVAKQISLSGEGVPAPASAALLVGDPIVGRTLTCQALNTVGDLNYAWLRDGVVVPGQTSRTFELGESDRGHRLSCRVTATNELGSVSTTSAESGTVSERDLSVFSREVLSTGVCRHLSLPPLRGLQVVRSTPTTDVSPTVVRAKKAIRLQIGSRSYSGRAIRVTPRSLVGVDDGLAPVRIGSASSAVVGQATLATCRFAAGLVGGRGTTTRITVGSANAMESVRIHIPSLRLAPGKGNVGRLRIISGPGQRIDQSLPVSGRHTSVNGVDIAIRAHAVTVDDLPAEAGRVELRLARNVVRGESGRLRVSSRLAHGGSLTTDTQTSWRKALPVSRHGAVRGREGR